MKQEKAIGCYKKSQWLILFVEGSPMWASEKTYLQLVGTEALE